MWRDMNLVGNTHSFDLADLWSEIIRRKKHDGSLRLPPKKKHYDQSLVMFRLK